MCLVNVIIRYRLFTLRGMELGAVYAPYAGVLMRLWQAETRIVTKSASIHHLDGPSSGGV